MLPLLNLLLQPPHLSVISLTETDSKKPYFSIKKENAAKSKFKANAPAAAAKEEGKDKQEDIAQIENAVSDKMNTLQEANQLLQQKKYNEALLKYNQYLKSHPKSCDAINGVAQCYDATNKMTDAILYYTKLSQQKCGKISDAALLKLGELYIKNKQPNEAKKIFKEALQSKYLDIAEQAKKELDKL
jgi:TolA-binding protein